MTLDASSSLQLASALETLIMLVNFCLIVGIMASAAIVTRNSIKHHE